MKTFSKIHDEASKLGVGIHIHLAESGGMMDKQKPRLSEVELLEKIVFLDSHVLAAHCVDLTVQDRHVLAKRGAKVVYVPVANAKLGLGIARIEDLLKEGVPVAFGTDGPASNNSLDMFETMKMGALLQRCAYRNPRIFSAYDALRLATVAGAEVLGLDKEIGTIEVGKKADIVLIDLEKPHLQPLHDVFSSLVYSARGGDVDTVIVDGKILMWERRVETLNESAVIDRATKTSLDLLSRRIALPL